ncbi:hypothetical protein ACNH6C_06865 [Bdellovibrio bacteriovorus]|uniref:hypothetical protein n=1 Tax=Bdellovibrio bacteriovorus TaxID=959 RepID=UPI003A80A996
MISVKNFIVCDDIREERRNKTSLMGIYGDRVNISTKLGDTNAVSLPLSFFISLSCTELPKNSLNFVAEFTYSKPVAKAEGDILFHNRGVTNLALSRIPFSFTNGGLLNVSLKIFESGKEVLSHSESIKINISRMGIDAEIPN